MTNDYTNLVIQCTRLECMRRNEDRRRAVWTAIAWGIGFVMGIVVMLA